MRIGTLSQAITSVMIFQLIEEGKISLDTKLSVFFTEIPNSENITIKHLLQQSSGLHNMDVDIEKNIFDSWFYSTQSRDEMIAGIAQWPNEFEPGGKIQYSAANYILLGYIIESVMSSQFAQQVQSRVIERCEMSRTYSAIGIERKSFEIPSYYRNDGWIEFPSSDLSGAIGNASVVSNSHDLTRFCSALFEGQLISASSLSTMLGLQSSLAITKDPSIGKSGEGYLQSGGIDNFGSMMLYVPEDSICFAITLAGMNYPIGQLFWKSVELYYGVETEIPSFKPIKIPARSTKKYTGIYTSSDGTSFEITTRKEALFLLMNGKSSGKLELEALDENWFQNESMGIMIRFGRNEKNKIDQLLFYQGRLIAQFTKTGS
ncbi:MAG: serine hydrolase domain-containing protein [Flavobacteriales bacterium]